MVDLTGWNNLVANTAYLKAQQIDRNDLRKQWLNLSLPKPRSSSTLLAFGGKTYESLCEQQPIGRKLFQQFLLSSKPQYVAAAQLLQELHDWSFAEENSEKEKIKQNILIKYRQPQFRSILSCPAEENAERCNSLSCSHVNEMTVDQTREVIKVFLKANPFHEYMRSPFFYKFLQWKEYETQKISDKYFYEFRTLGKGGFGEVGS